MYIYIFWKHVCRHQVTYFHPFFFKYVNLLLPSCMIRLAPLAVLSCLSSPGTTPSPASCNVGCSPILQVSLSWGALRFYVYKTNLFSVWQPELNTLATSVNTNSQMLENKRQSYEFNFTREIKVLKHCSVSSWTVKPLQFLLSAQLSICC